MTKYSRHGKITKQLSILEFEDLTANIKDKKNLAFCVLLFYTGVRVSELLRATKEQFSFSEGNLIFNVGPRLKHGNETVPLKIPLSLKYMDIVMQFIKHRKNEAKVFDFNRVTAWRLIRDYYSAYPHYFRLNRITTFLEGGFNLIQVQNWTGQKSLNSINSYVGIVDINKMSDSLVDKRKVHS